jgi:hypothetical protein
MELKLLRAFQMQLLTQCKFFMFAAREVNCSFEKRDTNRAFYALQNLLTASANISKALWGQGGRFAKERKPLRDSISISDDSPLREVTMRNNFDHFDERLERWWKETKTQTYLDLNLISKSGTHGVDEIDRFRAFDSRTTDLTF